MALENLIGPNVFISNLVRTNPAIDDPVSQGDDHLRGIKNVTLNSFPNITGAVTLTQAQLNEVPTKYAPLDAPAFTGIPTAPTAAPGTNTTQLATTAFAKVAAEGSAIGVGQTWQVLTGSRALNTDYTNSTSKAIMVSVCTETAVGNATLVGLIGGIEIARQQLASGGAVPSVTNITIIVPPGAVYKFTGATTLKLWSELR